MSCTKRSGSPSGVMRLTGPATSPKPWVKVRCSLIHTRLGIQLVWRHLEALEEGGVDAEPAYPDHGQHHEARHQEAPAATTDLEHAGRRAEERDRSEGPQSREGGVDVGVGSAKDHAARRVGKLVAVEPEADGPEDQGEGGQAQEVIAGAHR